MKKDLRTEDGFTLLELLISMAIIAVIVGIALGGMRFGITAREVGDQKTDTYQRLRFIGEQLSSKIKSYHPLFIQPNPTPAGGIINQQTTAQQKLLAFEGLEHSIRFITFAENLTVTTKNPWLHEVLFYLGKHPQTGETGIIMMEQEMLFDDEFVASNSNNTQYIMLAKDISYLNFRYYRFRKLSAEELQAQTDPSILYADEWVNQIPLNYAESANPTIEDLQDKISSPRAIEVSIGLTEQSTPGKTGEPQIIYLPPMIVPLNSGIQIERS